MMRTVHNIIRRIIQNKLAAAVPAEDGEKFKQLVEAFYHSLNPALVNSYNCYSLADRGVTDFELLLVNMLDK